MNLQYFGIFIYIWWLLKFVWVFFCRKLTMMNLQYFCIFMYIWWLLKFLGCYFVTIFCHFYLYLMASLIFGDVFLWKAIFAFLCNGFLNFWGCFLWKAYSLASINDKNPNILTKRPPVATTVPSGTQRHHWGIGILGYIFDPGPRNPTTFLWLCSPGDYRQSIESPMGVQTFNCTEKALTFTIYDCILRIRQKSMLFVLWSSN